MEEVMSDFYNSSHRALQDRFDTRRLADRLEAKTVHTEFTPADKQFIEQRDMFFLATVDGEGRVNCSYKGGAPGFVRVLEPDTLVFPDYDGNGMYLSLGNVAQTGQVGLLFIDFERQTRMRVNGEAQIREDDPLLAEYAEGKLIVRVRAREIFPNCPRYIHKMKLIERSHFVPRSDCATPVPGWKRSDWAVDVLPANDSAHDPTRKTRDR